MRVIKRMLARIVEWVGDFEFSKDFVGMQISNEQTRGDHEDHGRQKDQNFGKNCCLNFPGANNFDAWAIRSFVFLFFNNRNII